MAAQQGGAPMDPAAAGMPPEGAPAEDPNAAAAENPAAMQEDMLNQMAGMVQDIIDNTME